MASMKDLLDQFDRVLIEAAIVERLRRRADVQLHDTLINAPLVYSQAGRQALAELYGEYIQIAESGGLPLLLGTPTWRANRERVLASDVNENVNVDAVRFLQALVAELDPSVPVRIGGVISCKNDCYLPEQALSADAAQEFHAWQIEQLSAAGADYLMAVTLPSVVEASGIAQAMQSAGLPYIISFVIGANGKLLDGTRIEEAIEKIDGLISEKPLGYFINCSYPSFLNAGSLPGSARQRLIGFQANASSLSHAELEASTEVKAESVSDWGALMEQLNTRHGLKILGGCCGTNGSHLQYLATATTDHR